MKADYDAAAIEAAAQDYWHTRRTFEVVEDPNREKFYCLSMFPYPSGALHMGHVRNYTIGDVISRYQRMLGKNVLQPMGWDAFGMPAENAAIERGIAPSRWTYDNIAHMRTQLRRLGFAYDWRRELTACRADYYRWEQWLFTKMFAKGLVYRAEANVNWDPVDQTVLANEQVVDGRGWRSGALVEQRRIPQWFMRITAYADELLEDLDQLTDWPERVKTMQRNWIGRSEGMDLEFSVKDSPDKLRVFTTRPDTLHGATYMAVAAEHPLAKQAIERSPSLAPAIAACTVRQANEAELQTMEKLGVDTGWRAIHPLSGELLPIYVANFVLMTYGEGAIMAVPAHDQRDWEFATKYGLPIKPVVVPRGFTGDAQDLVRDAAWTALGVLVNSGDLDGLTSEQAFEALARKFEAASTGQRRINYRLRDWGVSRQRYWGAPIPIIYCDACDAVPVPEQDLPVLLPENLVVDGAGSVLARLPEFHECSCPKCGAPARRETDTFDTFVESSWYFARFACPDRQDVMFDERVDYWLPVDHYVGGIEHAVLHLLYSRFYTKVMRDLGLVRFSEPFSRLLTQGMVLKDGAKMSKSKGNTVDPQQLIDRYGADTARLFTLFAAPPDQSLEWSDAGVAGANRYLRRLWAFIHEFVASPTPAIEPVAWSDLQTEPREVRQRIHQTLSQAGYDMARGQYNTVVSAAMKILNELATLAWQQDPQARQVVREGLDILLRVLAPMVPHVCHAAWQALGNPGALVDQPWPRPDDRALHRDLVQLVVQVNGKLRGRIQATASMSEAEIRERALADPNVRRFLKTGDDFRIVLVPGKLVNIVID